MMFREGIQNGLFRDVVRRLYDGVFYFKGILRFYGTLKVQPYPAPIFTKSG